MLEGAAPEGPLGLHPAFLEEAWRSPPPSHRNPRGRFGPARANPTPPSEAASMPCRETRGGACSGRRGEG